MDETQSAPLPDSSPRGPFLLRRIELRLGLAFWIVLATTASLCGALSAFAPYAAVVVAFAALWPIARRRRWAGLVADWLPLPAVVFTYETLANVVPVCWTNTIDPWLRDADRSLFAQDPGVLLESWVSPPLTNAFSLAYGLYYVLPLFLAIWFYVRERVAFRELVAGEIGALFIGYLGYLYLPAVGPYMHHPETFSVALSGDFVGDAIRLLNADRSTAAPRDAFPSLHTCNAVTILLVCWKHDRRAFLVYLVPMTALIAATVYLRFHYVVDVAAGALLAIAWQAFVPHFVRRDGLRGDEAGPDLQSPASHPPVTG